MKVTPLQLDLLLATYCNAYRAYIEVPVSDLRHPTLLLLQATARKAIEEAFHASTDVSS